MVAFASVSPHRSVSLATNHAAEPPLSPALAVVFAVFFRVVAIVHVLVHPHWAYSHPPCLYAPPDPVFGWTAVNAGRSFSMGTAGKQF